MKNSSKNVKFTLFAILIALVIIPSLGNDKVQSITPSLNQTQNQSLSHHIPSWIKHDARWWADGEIGDTAFINGIEYLIDRDVVQIPPTMPTANPQEVIPAWIKNSSALWADGKVSDSEFISAIQYLVENQIIQINTTVGSNTNLITNNATATNVTSATSTGGTIAHRIILFTPNPTSDLLTMLQRHNIDVNSNNNDLVVSFSPRVLNTYSNIQRIILGYSQDTIRQAIQTAESNPKPIEYIGYDNEANNEDLSTPSEEVQNPGLYTNMSADLVHQAGYKFGAGPTEDLLMKEYKHVDWSKVDLLIMQLQRFTKDQDFTSIVNTVASYVRAENPNILIFVQVNPALDTNSNLANVFSNISSNIDGLSIVIEGAIPNGTVDDLLTRIGR